MTTGHRSQMPIRLSEYKGQATQRHAKKDEDTRKLRHALAMQSYHLPGNTWRQDWVQYFRNNHPLFGICFHHKLHPLGIRERMVYLTGSVAFGLAITNIIYLMFLYHGEDINEPILKIDIRANANVTGAGAEERRYEYVVTHGMIAWLTLGGLSHSMFDLTIWHITACTCCFPGETCSMFGSCRKIGYHFVFVIVIMTVALATFVVVLRAAIASEQEKLKESGQDPSDNDIVNPFDSGDGEIDWSQVDGWKSFEFLWGYLVELGLALLVYYPLVGTILFSGCLGCGRLPYLGGRPRAMRRSKEPTLERSVSGETVDEEALG